MRAKRISRLQSKHIVSFGYIAHRRCISRAATPHTREPSPVFIDAGKQSLANNIAKQYNDRKAMFVDANIEFRIDIYGQDYTPEMLEQLIDLVEELTGNRSLIDFITN